MPTSQERLYPIIEGLSEDETQAARQLLGMSMALGPSGAVVLRHFLDSLFLFALGRLLLFLLERIGTSHDQIELVHIVSKWYEIGLFVSFALFSLQDVYQARFGWGRGRGVGE